MEISPNQTTIPSNGMISSLIKVNAEDNVTVSPYTLVTRAEVYSNTSISDPSNDNAIEGVDKYLLKIKDIVLPITIDEPLSVLDYFNTALNTWGTGIRNLFEIKYKIPIV